MLKIRRSPPNDLFFELTDQPREQLLRWAQRSPEERRQRRAPIDHDLFRASNVADMVVSDFEGHCAFCEREIGTAEGISHFRPLSSPYDARSTPSPDHYAWLAYEWQNLFLICRRCIDNRGDQFPVLDHRAQFLATFDEVRAVEKPLIIDPTVDNPLAHLMFLVSGICFPKKPIGKGSATVQLLGLNDEELVWKRREAIEAALDTWRAALEGNDEIPPDFLVRGSYRGACRDVIARTLKEFGIATLATGNGMAFAKNLRMLARHAGDEERSRMAGSIELVANSDGIRSVELTRRIEGQMTFVTTPRREALVSSLKMPPGELAHVRISNFRAIDNLELSLAFRRSRRAGATSMLLLGENAVGKSTCLAGIALALLGTREARKLRMPYYELARSTSRASWDIWNKRPLEVEAHLFNRKQAASFVYDPVRGRIDGTDDQSAVVLGYGPHRYFATAKGRRGTSGADRVRSLFDTRHPLPDPSDWLGTLRGSTFDEVARTARTILPIGDDDHLVNDPRAGICVFAQGQLTPIGQLSEGYRSVFAMVADICRSLLDHWSNLEKAHAVVMIDEIETHLHPRWKMRVLSSLRRAFPQVQFIATTHDPLCVRGMDDGEVVVLVRDENGHVQQLEDLPQVSGMRAEQLLTSEYFGLSSTIDPEIQLEIARMAEAVETDPAHAIGPEASRLVERLTVGDSAAAQIIQEALLKYLREREQPAGGLSSHARSEAVGEVFRALRYARAG